MLSDFGKKFLEKTKKRETETAQPISQENALVQKTKEENDKKARELKEERRNALWKTVSAFLAGPASTLIALIIIELTHLPPDTKALEAFCGAFRQALARSDMGFLAFSLALSVVIEGTTNSEKPKARSKVFYRVECVLGAISILIYGLVEGGLQESFFSENLAWIHLALLLTIIIIAIGEYSLRHLKDDNSKNLEESNGRETGANNKEAEDDSTDGD